MEDFITIVKVFMPLGCIALLLVKAYYHFEYVKSYNVNYAEVDYLPFLLGINSNIFDKIYIHLPIFIYDRRGDKLLANRVQRITILLWGYFFVSCIIMLSTVSGN
jgi:hypothetical protein